ncbi:MAG: asparaginase [Clostridia bacterium]|nr:asparaginase [Clostridia bacterium]
MKNILLIPIGGTICTEVNDMGTLSVSKTAGIKLKSNFEASDSLYAKKVNIEVAKNLCILSENMTVAKWNAIIDTYCQHTKDKVYDGIIFAHGTDTLAYSAALFSILLSGTDTPVFFVSANERLESPRSNGNANFRCAIECIYRGIVPNVYAVYKNLSDNRMYLHLASRLEQCKNYSEDFFSKGAIDITDMDESNYSTYFKEIEKLYPQNKAIKVVDIYNMPPLKECVLMIQPYVGINYSIYNYKKYNAVLHGTYHSGTACAEKTLENADYGENSILYMMDCCAEADIDVYYSPAKLSGEIYETTGIISNHKSNPVFLYGYTTEVVYAKLLIAYSIYNNKEKAKEFIKTNHNINWEA